MSAAAPAREALVARRDLRGVPVALELVAAPRYRRTARRPHAEHRATASPRTLLRELHARFRPLAYGDAL